MHTMRQFFRDRPRLAVLLIALGFLFKAMVPGGYMVAPDSMTLSVAVCADTQGERVVRQISIPMEAGAAQDKSDEHSRSSGACAFSALALAALDGADGVLLAAALLFILAIGFLPVTVPQLVASGHRRPPSRGPPLPA